MTSAAQMIHVAHGSPSMDSCFSIVSEGGQLPHCYLCSGDVTRGMLVVEWMGSNFTDQTRAPCPLSPVICEACVFLSSRVSPVLGRDVKEGKKFGACFRNVSNAVEVDWIGVQAPGYANYSKGEKPAILAFLERDHAGIWGIGIADTGQKHVAPFTPMNGPRRGGVVLFEEALVSLPSDLGLVYQMRYLLTAGATKDEIECGDYRSQTWGRCRREVELFEKENGGERGSEWFALALWLAQRDEAQVEERLAAEKAAATKQKREKKTNANRPKKTARVTAGGDGASDPPVVCGDPEEAGSSGLLGSDPGHDPSRVPHDHNPVGVGKQRSARPADQGARQFRLPGFD
jgi:hypothetical protein